MKRTRLQQALSWAVHGYTALGGVLGFAALMAAGAGESRLALLLLMVAFLLLMVAFVIDVTDGMLARRVRVGEHLPQFSGARLDDAIDVLTYIYVPLFIVAREEVLPHAAWLVPPLLAGLYAYGQVGMKTEDNFFLGFPSYWNVIALYMFWFRPGPVSAVAWVLIPTVLTFVPTRYLYPSKNAAFWKLNLTLSLVWFVLICGLLLTPAPDIRLVWLSLIYPALYMGLSFYMEWRIRHSNRPVT